MYFVRKNCSNYLFQSLMLLHGKSLNFFQVNQGSQIWRKRFYSLHYQSSICNQRRYLPALESLVMQKRRFHQIARLRILQKRIMGIYNNKKYEQETNTFTADIIISFNFYYPTTTTLSFRLRWRSYTDSSLDAETSCF